MCFSVWNNSSHTTIIINTITKRNRIPLPYALQAFRSAQAGRTFDTLRAIRRCGTHSVLIIVDIVPIVVNIAVSIHISGIVIIVTRGAQPPKKQWSHLLYNPVPMVIILNVY